MENQYLDDMNEMSKDAQIDEIEKEYRNEKSKAKKRRDIINYIAEKVCNDEYARNQLGGPNKIFAMSDIELRDFIVENYYNQKKEMATLVKDIQTLYQNSKKQVQELSSQVLTLQKELELCKSNTQINPLNTPLTNPNNNQLNAIKEKVQQDNIEAQDLIVIGNMVVDVQEKMNQIDLYQEELIKIMGETGYSEAKQIYEIAMQRTNTNETTLKNKFNELDKGGFLDKENVSTALRKKLSVYALNDLGKIVYKKLTNKNPVTAEKDILKRQHATLQHAYCIKDTATILEQLAYTNICIDSSTNSIKVAGGHRYVPDITADFDANTKTFWEVELGHHKDGDFFEKLNKAAKVTDTVYIITNDNDMWKKLKLQIGRYQAKVIQTEQKIKLDIYLGTMTQLRSRNIFTNKECLTKIG